MQSGQMLGQRCHFASPAGVLRGVTVAENYLFRCWTQRRFFSFLALFNRYPYYLDATIKLHLFSPRFPRITRHLKRPVIKRNDDISNRSKITPAEGVPLWAAQIMCVIAFVTFVHAALTILLSLFIDNTNKLKVNVPQYLSKLGFLPHFGILFIILATKQPDVQPMAAWMCSTDLKSEPMNIKCDPTGLECAPLKLPVSFCRTSPSQHALICERWRPIRAIALVSWPGGPLIIIGWQCWQNSSKRNLNY